MRRLNNPPHINKEMPVRGEQKKKNPGISLVNIPEYLKN